MDPHDEALFAMMLEQDIDDEETKKVDRYQTLTTLVHIVVGIELDQLSQIERCKTSELYIRKKGFGPGETQVALGNFYSPKEYLTC